MKAQTIGCREFTCLIVVQDVIGDSNTGISYEQFKLIKIENLEQTDAASYTISIKTITDQTQKGKYQVLLSSAVYYLDDTLTAFFTFYTEKFGYECGDDCTANGIYHGWQETDYSSEEKGVSIIASTRSKDCLGILGVDDWSLKD